MVLLACALTGALACASAATAQTLDFFGTQVTIAPLVTGAPYAADAETTMTQVLANGTRIQRRATAKLYRDSDGRVRREQTILGLAALDPERDSRVVVTIADPVAGVSYTLDPATRVARRAALGPRAFRGTPPPPPPPPPPPAPAGSSIAPPPPPPAPPRPREEDLGMQEIEGLQATGVRSTLTIPAGQIGNDRPVVVTNERWEAAELQLVLRSVHDDPRTGRVEFRLTNVRRGEPPQDLFAVPSDYVVVDGPPPPPPPPPPPAHP